MAVLGQALEQRNGGRLPFREELLRFGGEGGELGVAEDGGLHLGDGEVQRGVAGAGGFPEQGGAQAGHDLPVVAEGIEVALGDAAAPVAVDERLDDLGVDLVAVIGLALERDHVLEAGALGDSDGRLKALVVAVFVGDIFDEQHEQDIILVLAGVHAATQFIAGGPEGGVEVGFLDCHELPY